MTREERKDGGRAHRRSAWFYLLSPANLAGKRARLLLGGEGSFELATRLRTRSAPLGEVFAFVSGLYFRGKLAYATRFGRRGGVFVIVPGRGLLSPDARIRLADLREIAAVPVDLGNPRYLDPLIAGATKVAARRPAERAVLLGSVATAKYLDPLASVFGDRLWFPHEFVGRGDMSRGGLMLRLAAGGRQMRYIPLAGAARHGKRPPRLEPVSSTRRGNAR